MKKKKRRGGQVRRLILPAAAVLLVLVLAAGIRFAAGRLLSGREAASSSGGGQLSSAGSATAEPASAAGGSTQGAAAAELEPAGAEGPEEGGTGPGAELAAADAGQAPGGAADPAAGNTGEAPGGAAAAGAGGTGSTGAPAAAGEEKPAYDHTATELEEGREYLRALDERSPVEVAEMIGEARKEVELRQALAAYGAQREEYRAHLEEGDLWESFTDYALLGDSRSVGFSIYNFLSYDRVLADSGDTILAIRDRLDALRALHPRYIFLCYGINDVTIELWQDADEYAFDYGQILDELQSALPEAEIYVNSILPALDWAAEGNPKWQELPAYSEAVRGMCAEKGIAFIDNDALAKERASLYEQDGVHFQPDFYRYWGENQLLGIFDRAHGYLTFRMEE